MSTALYLDTSVALAHLLAEDRRLPPELWLKPLFASRLLEYELWTRLNARGLASSHVEATQSLLSRINLVELNPTVLERALEPFPTAVCTLDALHLATMHFLLGRRVDVALATYDNRMATAAGALEWVVVVF